MLPAGRSPARAGAAGSDFIARVGEDDRVERVGGEREGSSDGDVGDRAAWLGLSLAGTISTVSVISATRVQRLERVNCQVENEGSVNRTKGQVSLFE